MVGVVGSSPIAPTKFDRQVRDFALSEVPFVGLIGKPLRLVTPKPGARSAHVGLAVDAEADRARVVGLRTSDLSGYDRRMLRDSPTVTYPRVRLDALTDGIYAVAMTLLVLDVRLPDDFRPETAAELSRGLIGLWPKVFPYLLSFAVLGLRWLATVQVRSRSDRVGGGYIRWWLASLLLTTCIPFSTIVVGRHASLPPAVWLYAGNTALLAIASWWQLRLLPEADDDLHLRSRQTSSLLLLASSLLSIAWSLVDPSDALWAFMLNLAGPAFVRWRRRAEAR
jgi:uncharacterized membrane protein